MRQNDPSKDPPGALRVLLLAASFFTGGCGESPASLDEQQRPVAWTCYPKAEAIQQAVEDVADETTSDGHQHEWATIVFESSPGCWMYYPPFPGEFDHVDQLDLWNRIRILNEAEMDARAIVHSHNNPGSYTPGLSQGDRGAADLYGVNIVAVEPGVSGGDMSAVHMRNRTTGKEKTARKFGTKYDAEVFSDL